MKNNVIKNIFDNLKHVDYKSLAKRYWKVGVIALAVLVAIILLLPKGNTYKTPVKQMVAMSNAKTGEKMLDRFVEMTNGLGEDELNDILKIMKKTEAYESIENMMTLQVASMKDNFGEKYKTSASVKGKEKVDKEELEYMQERIDKMAENFGDMAESLKEDSTGLEEQGLSGKDIKKLIKAYESLAKIYGKAKVTKAYDVEVKTKIKGSNLDETMKGESTMRVYKVGGRWISEEALSAMNQLAY